MNEMKKIADLLGKLTEADQPCPSAEDFDIPLPEAIKKKTFDSVSNSDFDTEVAAILIDAVAKNSLGEPFNTWSWREWEQRCSGLGKAIAEKIIPHIHALGEDEVGSLSQTRGSGPSAYVAEAPVLASFKNAEYVEIEDVDEESDGRSILKLRFDVPLSYGEYRRAYP